MQQFADAIHHAGLWHSHRRRDWSGHGRGVEVQHVVDDIHHRVCLELGVNPHSLDPLGSEALFYVVQGGRNHTAFGSEADFVNILRTFKKAIGNAMTHVHRMGIVTPLLHLACE